MNLVTIITPTELKIEVFVMENLREAVVFAVKPLRCSRGGFTALLGVLYYTCHLHIQYIQVTSVD